MENILKTNDLTKIYGSKIVLNKVNMTINKGDIYGFVGKNGAGKTTLMRTILGLAFENSGDYQLFNGMDRNIARTKIGALIEYPVYYEKFSAYENMKRFSILLGQGEGEINNILKFVGLGDTGRKPVGQFSLGMKQRLGIAIAMLSNPEFMILDEPVNGLDPYGITEVRDLIHKLNKEKGVTFLISSHLLDELSKIANKFGIIDNGTLVEEFNIKDIETKFTKKIIIETPDTTRAAEVIKNNFDIKDNEIVIEDGKVYVSSHTEETGEVNRVLVTNDITVNSIYANRQTLEQYYMQKVGL